jgi:hypothetical protein
MVVLANRKLTGRFRVRRLNEAGHNCQGDKAEPVSRVLQTDAIHSPVLRVLD